MSVRIAFPMNPCYPSDQAVSSPSRRSPDIGAGNRVRQLRVSQSVGPDMAYEVRGLPQRLRRSPVSRGYQPDSFAMLLAHETHGFEYLTSRMR